MIGLSLKEGCKIFLGTLDQLKFPIITITSVLGFAFVANYSSMSLTMALALAGTGILYPFFSPMLGWLGVFLTGSDTSSNALFCKLQYSSAKVIGIDPVITVSANACGGVTGKMISPQSIAVGTAAVGLVGRESELFRFTMKHSFLMLFVISILTLLQAYVIKWIVPVYNHIEGAVTARPETGSHGTVYLLILLAGILGIAVLVILLNRNKRPL